MRLSFGSFVFSCSGWRVFEDHPWDLEFSPNLEPKVRKVDLLVSPGQAASPGSKTGKELKLCLEMDGGWGEGECGAGEAEIADRWLCRNGRWQQRESPAEGLPWWSSA